MLAISTRGLVYAVAFRHNQKSTVARLDTPYDGSTIACYPRPCLGRDLLVSG